MPAEQVVTELIVDARKSDAGVDTYARSMQRAGTVTEEAQQRIGRSFSAADRAAATYLGRLDPVIAAQNRLGAEARQAESAQRALDRQLMVGATSMADYTQKSALLKGRLGELQLTTQQLASGTISAEKAMLSLSTAAERSGAIIQRSQGAALNDNIRLTTAATASTGQMRASLVNLGQQAQDVAVSLQAGQAPLTVLMQQGSQIATIFAATPGGVSGVLGAAATAIKNMISPTTLAVAGIAALAGGFAFLVARAVEAETAVRRFDVQLRGLGQDGQATGAQLEEAARRLRDVGLTAAEAQDALFKARAAGLTATGAERVVRAGQNLIPVLGEGAPERLLSAVSARSIDQLGRLAQQLGIVSAQEIAAAREAARFGREIQILDDWLVRIERHTSGLNRQALSPLGQQLRDLRINAAELIDAMARNSVIRDTVELINNMVRGLKFLFELQPPDWFNKLMGIVPGSQRELNSFGLPTGAFVAPIPSPSSSATTGASGVSVAQALSIIRDYEGGRPMIGYGGADLSGYPQSVTGFPMWPGRMGPSGLSTAAGLYQITRSTWDPIARNLGVSDFSEASQTKVATELFNTRGFQPWTVGNEKLAEAVKNLNVEIKQTPSAFADAGRAREEFFSEADVAFKKLLRAGELEIANSKHIAEGWAQSAETGMRAEASARALQEAFQLYGEDVANRQEAILRRANQIIEAQAALQRTRSAQDLSRERETQEQLKLQVSLSGQLPEIAQRELTILQAKQTISRDFPLLTEQEKANRLAMVQATADLNVKLAETHRAQQQIDSLFSSIGNTISSAIGNVIDGIFDRKRVIDWGQTLKSALSSIVSQVAQALVIRPLTGSILGALGASANVVNQFGSFGGSSGSGGGIFDFLFKGAGVAKDVAGLGSSSSGGLFSGVNSFIDASIGPSLGFATPGTASLSSMIGIESSTLAAAGIPSAGSAATAGSLFGMTTLSSVLPFVGIAGGILGMILPSLFGNKKPRNQSAGANFDLSNFELTAGFSGGNSQIDQATQQVAQGVQQFLALLKTTGGQLAGNVLLQNGVNTGFTVDSSLPGYSGRFNLGKDPASALNTIELALARSLTGISDTMKTVIDQIGDPAEIQSAIAFATAYENLSEAAADAFKTVEDAAKTAAGPFATAMEQIKTTFQGLTDQANRFGLALDPINAALAEATRRLQTDFIDALNLAFNEASGAGFINQLQSAYDATLVSIRESQAIGLGEDATTQGLIRQIYESQLSEILSGLDQTQLDQVVQHFTGLNDAIVILAQSAMSATDATSDLAAAQQLAAQAAQAAKQIQDYLNQLNSTISPFVSPEDALLQSQVLFEQQRNLARTGDVEALSNITQYADAYIKNIEAYYASSLYGQSLVNEIKQQLGELIGIVPVQQDPVLVTNQLLTEQVSKTEDVATTVATGADQTVLTITGGTQQLINANNSAAQSAIAQNSADLATVAGVVNDTATANIAMNQASSAALIAANDQATTDLLVQSDAAAQALIAANDNATVGLIADAHAQTAAILAGSSADAMAIGSVTQVVGDQLSMATTGIGNSQITALNNGFTTLVQAGLQYANNQVAATLDAANSLINTGATYSNAIGSAVYGAANSIVSTNASYGNSTVIAIGTAAATNDNLLSTANNWLQGLYTSGVDQRDTMIRQLQDLQNKAQAMLDELRLMRNAAAA